MTTTQERPVENVSLSHPTAVSLALHVTPARCARLLGFGVLFLAVVNAISQYIFKAMFGRDNVFGLIPRFNMGMEANVPTWYSSVLLLTAAALAAYVAHLATRIQPRTVWHWRGLAAMFLLMSIDETASFHELLTPPFRNALQGTGVLHYTWVVPMAGLVLIVGLAYLPFLWRLPRVTARRFLLAGVIYVSGSLGMEVVGGYLFTEHNGQNPLLLTTSVLIEETMEMLGIVLMIYALLEHIRPTTAPAVASPSHLDRRDQVGPTLSGTSSAL